MRLRDWCKELISSLCFFFKLFDCWEHPSGRKHWNQILEYAVFSEMFQVDLYKNISMYCIGKATVLKCLATLPLLLLRTTSHYRVNHRDCTTGGSWCISILWYLYPIPVQKYLGWPISSSSQPALASWISAYNRVNSKFFVHTTITLLHWEDPL